MENKETAFQSVYTPDRSKLTSFSDGTLRTEDGYVFNIHRFLLARKSRYFYALFSSLNADRRDFMIPGVKGKILDIILCFIYTGNIAFSEDTLIDLLYASDYLVYNDLSLKIQEYAIANLSINNCLQLLIASNNLGQKIIYEESFRFLQTHFEYVVTEEGSPTEAISLDILKELLGNRNTCVRNENIIWNLIVKWTEFDEVQRQTHVPELLQCLKVNEMDESLASRIMEHKIVVKNHFCDNLNEFKSVRLSDSNRQILIGYLQAYPNSALEFNKHRVTSKIHFFMKDFMVENVRFINVHITYDDKIDLWRKVLEFETHCSTFITIGSRIYLFERAFFRRTEEPIIKSFDFIQNQWILTEQPERDHRDSYALKHEGLIFMLGESEEDEDQSRVIVDVFDPVLNAWSDVTSMLPVKSFQAVSLGSKIYVVGHVPGAIFNNPAMMAQEYDPQSDEWALIPLPAKYYDCFSLVSYGDRIYIIGGTNDVTADSKAVEVFDTIENKWRGFVSIPYAYYSPYAFVINDLLIVQDSNYSRSEPSPPRAGPAIYWSDKLQRWNRLNKSSALNNLSGYELLTIEDAESLKMITNENRENISLFVKSPFK